LGTRMNPQIEREPPTPPKDHILRFLAKLLKRFRWREVTDMIGKILGLGAGLLFCLAVNWIILRTVWKVVSQ
jgi:hypothetical protein